MSCLHIHVCMCSLCLQYLPKYHNKKWVFEDLYKVKTNSSTQVFFQNIVVCCCCCIRLDQPGGSPPLGGVHTVLLNCLHYFRLTSALLSSSVTFSMILADVSSFSTSSWNISLYSTFCPHLYLIAGHVWRMCFWISVSFLQSLHMMSVLHLF